MKIFQINHSVLKAQENYGGWWYLPHRLHSWPPSLLPRYIETSLVFSSSKCYTFHHQNVSLSTKNVCKRRFPTSGSAGHLCCRVAISLHWSVLIKKIKVFCKLFEILMKYFCTFSNIDAQVWWSCVSLPMSTATRTSLTTSTR